ncbi:MAG: cyclic nucleotide-binding domain-containing protein [Alphaproteobacteria bacterium]|nr:cyclic nucleotide-binding domain-containing protein [Alphaproteobacteria bacterium]MBT7943713.1 cyclic nucleotide-binding domain-containing protein [Alphaproteobacteria bacterium]
MAAGFEQKIFKPNEYLLKEGTPSDAAFLISSGKVEVRKGAMSDSPQTLAVLEKGAVIGEMSLFDDKPPIASAIAIEETTTSAISRSEFQRRVGEMDPVMRVILKIMVERIRDMSKKPGIS